MVNLSAQWAALSSREQRILVIGAPVAIAIALYFFIIEPLQKKTAQLNTTTQTRLTQLTEMQQMATALLNNPSSNATTQTYEAILGNLVASESLENSKRTLKTQAISHEKAHRLLMQLAPLGKTTLLPSGNSVELWFEVE